MCLRSFLPVLSLGYKRELETLRRTNAAISEGDEELTWTMMVHDARARSDHLTVVPELHQITGVGSAKVALPSTDTTPSIDVSSIDAVSSNAPAPAK